jgi:hypothetical protein
MGYNEPMARVDCNCGWFCQVPDPVRRALVCPVCRATVQPRALVPYSYAPFSTWHAPARPLRHTVLPQTASANTPARVALICGGMSLFMAGFTATNRMDKGVVSLALLALATAMIGLHLAYADKVHKRGRTAAGLGMAFAVIALMMSPLPPRQPSKTVQRSQPAPTVKICPEPAPAKIKAPTPKAAPAPTPASPVDEEQEEGF